MRSRWRRLGIFAALALVAIAWLSLRSRQPSYHGRSVDSWLRDLDYGPKHGAGARVAVRALGTNALPRILYHLNHRDALWKQRFWFYVQVHGIWRNAIEDDFLWHRRAARACGELGLLAQPALPSLAAAVTNSQAPEQVMEALGKLLPNSICVLTDAVLMCKSPTACQFAIKALGQACSYPEVCSTSICGLSNAVHRFITGSDAIIELARIRDGSYPPATKAAAALALQSFQPIPQYSEKVNALLTGRPISEIPEDERGRREFRSGQLEQ